MPRAKKSTPRQRSERFLDPIDHASCLRSPDGELLDLPDGVIPHRQRATTQRAHAREMRALSADQAEDLWRHERAMWVEDLASADGDDSRKRSTLGDFVPPLLPHEVNLSKHDVLLVLISEAARAGSAPSLDEYGLTVDELASFCVAVVETSDPDQEWLVAQALRTLEILHAASSTDAPAQPQAAPCTFRFAAAAEPIRMTD